MIRFRVLCEGRTIADAALAGGPDYPRRLNFTALGGDATVRRVAATLERILGPEDGGPLGIYRLPDHPTLQGAVDGRP